MNQSLGEQWPDILSLVSPEPRPPVLDAPPEVWVAINPELLYSKAKEHLLGRLRNPRIPLGILGEYYMRARRLPPEIWDNLQISTDPRRLSVQYRQLRGEALDLLRLWFTEFLSHALNVGPDFRMGLHITPRDNRYKI